MYVRAVDRVISFNDDAISQELAIEGLVPVVQAYNETLVSHSPNVFFCFISALGLIP
jgi:hypothetical protein